MSEDRNGNGYLPEQSERDWHGRFTAGARGGPGRPPARRETSYLEATITSCSLAIWKKICERAVADALDGDRPAHTWLSNYLIGAPFPVSDRFARELTGVMIRIFMEVNAIEDPESRMALLAERLGQITSEMG